MNGHNQFEDNAYSRIELGQKLRATRQERGFSLRELAAKAEVSPSLLSQIENGKANPSVRSLHSIADALGVSVNYFFPNNPKNEGEVTNSNGTMTASEYRTSLPVDQINQSRHIIEAVITAHTSSGPVVRRAERPTIDLEGGVSWSRLTAAPEQGIEFLHIEYEAGARSGERMSHHHGREFTLVLEGELLIELGFDRHVLHAGDSISFNSETPHRLTNVGTTPLRAISVIFNKE